MYLKASVGESKNNICPRKSTSNDNHTDVDSTTIFPSYSENVCGLSTPSSSVSQSSQPNSQFKDTNGQPQVGRLAYFRQSLSEQGLSTEVKALLSASWRHGTHKNYDSALRKWERWCADANTSPIRSSLNSVLSFLTHQFQMGLSYRSVNLYRSAISSIHPRIDGFTMGTHPLVTRLLKGIFRGCLRQPLYCFHLDFRCVTLVPYIYIYIYIYI